MMKSTKISLAAMCLIGISGGGNPSAVTAPKADPCAKYTTEKTCTGGCEWDGVTCQAITDGKNQDTNTRQKTNKDTYDTKSGY